MVGAFSQPGEGFQLGINLVEPSLNVNSNPVGRLSQDIGRGVCAFAGYTLMHTYCARGIANTEQDCSLNDNLKLGHYPRSGRVDKS